MNTILMAILFSLLDAMQSQEHRFVINIFQTDSETEQIWKGKYGHSVETTVSTTENTSRADVLNTSAIRISKNYDKINYTSSFFDDFNTADSTTVPNGILSASTRNVSGNNIETNNVRLDSISSSVIRTLSTDVLNSSIIGVSINNNEKNYSWFDISPIDTTTLSTDTPSPSIIGINNNNNEENGSSFDNTSSVDSTTLPADILSPSILSINDNNNETNGSWFYNFSSTDSTQLSEDNSNISMIVGKSNSPSDNTSFEKDNSANDTMLVDELISSTSINYRNDSWIDDTSSSSVATVSAGISNSSMMHVDKSDNNRSVNCFDDISSTNSTTPNYDSFNDSKMGVSENNNNNSNGSLTDNPFSYSQTLQTFLEVKKYLNPTIMLIIFIVGFISNVTLIIILLRHKEMRTQSNACILSMALGDMISVIVNVPLFYAFLVSETWKAGVIACKLMWFSSDFAVGLSIFSVTILSVQRYHGIVRNHARVHKSSSTLRSHLATIIYIAIIWILSFGLAFRTAITASVSNNRCSSIADSYGPDYPKNFATLNLIVFCVIPLCVIAVFYSLTAIHLVRSSENIPGEVSTTKIKQINARKKGARIVLALAGVFFVSYVPWYSWQVIFFWGEFYRDFETTAYIYTILYFFFFGNLCFNTIALYLVSSTFRRYFNYYLFRKGNITENKTEALAKTNGIQGKIKNSAP